LKHYHSGFIPFWVIKKEKTIWILKICVSMETGCGRSHVEVENTTWEDSEAGANVLLHCFLKSANE